MNHIIRLEKGERILIEPGSILSVFDEATSTESLVDRNSYIVPVGWEEVLQFSNR